MFQKEIQTDYNQIQTDVSEKDSAFNPSESVFQSVCICILICLHLFLYPFASVFAQQTEQTFYDADKKIKKEVFQTKKSGGKNIKEGLYQIYYENGKT